MVTFFCFYFLGSVVCVAMLAHLAIRRWGKRITYNLVCVSNLSLCVFERAYNHWPPVAVALFEKAAKCPKEYFFPPFGFP